jgi:hypothetical protein
MPTTNGQPGLPDINHRANKHARPPICLVSLAYFEKALDIKLKLKLSSKSVFATCNHRKQYTHEKTLDLQSGNAYLRQGGYNH